MFNKTLTKKKFLLFSLISTTLFICLGYLNEQSCNIGSSCVALVGTATLYSLVVFILTLITYFLPNTTFRTWGTFTLVFVPLMLIASTFMSNDGSMFGPNQNAIFLIYSTGVYITLSILLIITKSILVYRNKKHV